MPSEARSEPPGHRNRGSRIVSSESRIPIEAEDVEGLTKLERAVLAKLLAGDHPILAALRSQSEDARLASREYTGAGFYCRFSVPSDVPRLA